MLIYPVEIHDHRTNNVLTYLTPRNKGEQTTFMYRELSHLTPKGFKATGRQTDRYLILDENGTLIYSIIPLKRQEA